MPFFGGTGSPNDEFTRAYEKLPVEHHTRVNVVTRGGERIVGEAGGDKGDLAQPKSDAQIAEKFLGVTEEFLGAGRAKAALERLWTAYPTMPMSADRMKA